MVVETRRYKMILLRFVMLLLVCTQPVISDEKTLKMVHVVYRHGARSPVRFYPNDKYQEKDWPDGAGWLTRKGIKIEYELGIFLKKRYIEDKQFINKTYKHKEVYVRSTGVDRCLQSAQLQLAGLFPPQGNQIGNSKIAWQPIPVHSVPSNNDPILRASRDFCPKRNAIWEERKRLPAYKKKVAESAELFKMLTNFTGMDINEDNYWIVIDASISERAEGLNIPEWADTLWTRLVDFRNWEFRYTYDPKGDELARLLGGPLLAKIVDNMANLRTNESLYKWPKMNIFSGHDHSLLALSTVLDIQIDIPEFGSCIMVELHHSTTTGYTVEMFYRNDNSLNPTRLKLRHCDFSCPLYKFINLTRNRVSKNRDEECGVH